MIISEAKEPASKTMWKQKLNSHGRETVGVCGQIDGYNSSPFVLGTTQGHLLQFSQKPPVVKPTFKCEVKIPKTQESISPSEVKSVLSKDTVEVGPDDKWLFMYLFIIPKKSVESHWTNS